MPANITLSGFKEFEQKCLNMTAEILEECDGEIEDAAKTWEGLAKDAAPVDFATPGLAGGVSHTEVVDHSADVVSNAEYSAFIEWGTKSRVRVPAELQAYAAGFISKGGSPGKAKEMIYAWCSRHGIPKNAYFLVYRSIMRFGIHPHPFFFIQEPVVEVEFLEHLRNILNTEH